MLLNKAEINDALNMFLAILEVLEDGPTTERLAIASQQATLLRMARSDMTTDQKVVFLGLLGRLRSFMEKLGREQGLL